MDATLLEPDSHEALFQKLLLESGSEIPGSVPPSDVIPSTVIKPKPGFCLKTRNDKEEKVFINICTAENVPQPKDISETDLLGLLDSDDPTGFRIPMSIGQPHAEVDKSGQGCTAFDVVIHPSFYDKMQKSQVFKSFFLTVTAEGIESKNDQLLSRDWNVLKNRKFVGTLQEQYIRTKSKPLIMEMDGSSSPGCQSSSKPPLIQEVSTKTKVEDTQSRGQVPEYRIIQDPAEGYPDFLVAEISLPKVKNAASMSVDIGGDRILLKTRSNAYYLDIYLPFDLVQEDCGAQFNRKTNILTITMPVEAR
ncbi:hypothetical protein ScPMuIL_012036 [Solemya velum]